MVKRHKAEKRMNYAIVDQWTTYVDIGQKYEYEGLMKEISTVK